MPNFEALDRVEKNINGKIEELKKDFYQWKDKSVTSRALTRVEMALKEKDKELQITIKEIQSQLVNFNVELRPLSQEQSLLKKDVEYLLQTNKELIIKIEKLLTYSSTHKDAITKAETEIVQYRDVSSKVSKTKDELLEIKASFNTTKILFGIVATLIAVASNISKFF